MYKRKRITPETFVTTWQTSNSVDEFCERTGMKRNSATVRASYYRKKGVALKKMNRGGGSGRKPLDVELLNQLISASSEEVVEEESAKSYTEQQVRPVC